MKNGTRELGQVQTMVSRMKKSYIVKLGGNKYLDLVIVDGNAFYSLVKC